MGNCQAAEAAGTAEIRHPGGIRTERIYMSVTANEIMNSNPGYYVAQEVSAPEVKQLKLLRPEEELVIGQVYRLISFEDVLKVFAARKSVRLGKLLKEDGGMEAKKNRATGSGPGSDPQSGFAKAEQPVAPHHHHHGGGCRRRLRQWRPALQSISELD